jgi:hypothetical protein
LVVVENLAVEAHQELSDEILIGRGVSFHIVEKVKELVIIVSEDAKNQIVLEVNR